MMIAADHPARVRCARGPAVGDGRPDRHPGPALPGAVRPGVNGVLGTPDILEDLLLLGALDDKVVVGSMNRGGLAGTTFEIDDKFTAYTAASLAAASFEGGKMLTGSTRRTPARCTPWPRRGGRSASWPGTG